MQSLAWERAKLPPSDKLVLLALADHAHDDGTSAKPGIAHLAWKTDLSERTVQRCLKNLEEAGLITPTAHAEGGRGYVTEYTLLLEGLPPKPISTSVDNSGEPTGKGDKLTPIADRERVTPVTERVTNDAEKGDTGDVSGFSRKEVVFTEPRTEPSEPKPKPREGSQAKLLDDFEDLWKTYPARDGKKLYKSKASAVWDHLTRSQRRDALAAVGNYAIACTAGITRAKDPHRWLTDRCFDDWLTPAVPDPQRANGDRAHTNGHHPEPTTNRGRGWDRSRESYEQYQARTHADA